MLECVTPFPPRQQLGELSTKLTCRRQPKPRDSHSDANTKTFLCCSSPPPLESFCTAFGWKLAGIKEQGNRALESITQNNLAMGTSVLILAVADAQKQLDSLYKLELAPLQEGASNEERALRTQVHHYFVAIKHQIDLFNVRFGKYGKYEFGFYRDSYGEVEVGHFNMIFENVVGEIELSFEAFDYARLYPELAKFVIKISVECNLASCSSSSWSPPCEIFSSNFLNIYCTNKSSILHHQVGDRAAASGS